MVCRQFSLSSVMIAQARTASWLDDAQVQSVFHALRHDPRVVVPGTDTPPPWDHAGLFATVMDHSRRDLDTNPVYRPRRRAGLRTRLERDIERDRAGLQTGDLTALARLQAGVAESQRQLRARLQFIAARKGMSEREVTQRFHELRDQAPRGRQERASEAERADLGLIPRDPRTRHALEQLMRAQPLREPQREVNRWVPIRPAPGDDNPVVEVGTSDVSNRVEARRRDGTVTAWHGIDDVDARMAQAAACGPADPDLFHRMVTGPDSNPYGGWRIRCDRCGQFVGHRPHACLTGIVAALETRPARVGAATVTAPQPTDIRSALDHDPDLSNINVPVEVDLGEGTRVVGAVQVRRFDAAVRSYRGEPNRRQDSALDIDDNGLGDTLQCTQCHTGTCHHSESARNLLRRHLESAGSIPRRQADQVATQAVLDAETQDRPQPATAREATAPPRVQVTPATLRLSDEPEAFRQFARLGHEQGVPFHARDGALTGQTQVRHFGIELEWTGPRDAPVEALRRAGILRTSRMMSYHHGQSSGWQEWTLEHDSSVTAELVTPVLSDDLSSWTQLQAACDAIREQGGQTHHAGSHTNIDAPQFEAVHGWRLAHLIRTHEDDIMRMGRTRSSQRSTGYRAALQDPGVEQWTSPSQTWRCGHHEMVDLAKAFRPNGRIEFRFPDASHDAGVIQAQVKLCAAMTNYVRTHDVEPGHHRPWGTSRAEGWAGRTMALPADEFAQRTAGIRGLIDALVDTDEDRIQLAQLWGRGNYFDTH